MAGSRLARISAEAAWVAGGQFLAFLGGFATIKLLTSELGPSAYGELALGISTAGALHMFVYGPIEQAALRYVSVFRERGQMGLLFHALRRLHSWAAALVVALAACAILISSVLLDYRWAWLALWACLLGVASGLNATLFSIQTALRRRPAVAMFQAGDVWLRFGLAFGGLVLAGSTANVALLGFCLAASATAALQLVMMNRNYPKDPATPSMAERRLGEPQALSELLAYGLPYVGFAGFAWLSTYADRWIILWHESPAEVGVYAALVQIANAPIALFLGVTTQFLVPVIFDRAGAGTNREKTKAGTGILNVAVALYALALVGIIATAALFAHPIVSLLTNAQFAEQAGLLWILCLGISLASTGQLLVIKGLARNRSLDYLVPKAIQVIVLLVGAWMLIAPLALTGVAIALCLSGAGYLAAVLRTNRQLDASGA